MSALAAETLLKRAESLKLLAELPEPKSLWKYFLLCTETPRPSHELDTFRSKLSGLAEHLNCTAETDKAGNVRFRLAASPGLEGAPGVCIQSHMDMVTSANSDTPINFSTDPINVCLEWKGEEQWMKARGTTLGADNGIGVAAALAVFEAALDPNFKHGQIEALFTADEETTMGGAENLAGAPYVTSEILLNVDSEEEYAICIGCAGGAENSHRMAVAHEEVDGMAAVHLTLKGLLGGHSGIEIHTGRANAIQCVNKLVRLAALPLGGRLVDIVGGGAPNVIPREASATVAVPATKVEDFKQALAGHFSDMKKVYLSVESRTNAEGQRESVMVLESSVQDSATIKCLSADSTTKVTAFIDSFHSGVVRMSYDVEGLVETSVNFSNAKIDGEHFVGHSFSRSSSAVAQAALHDQLVGYGSLCGATVSEPLNAFPGWDPDVNAVALKVMKKAHEEVIGREARVYAVHAGLECGLIKAVYPDISCVSVGPEVHHAHSPDECLLVPSVKRFYDLTIRFLEMIGKESK